MEGTIFKSADEGGMIVLQTREQYLAEDLRKLNDNLTSSTKKLEHDVNEKDKDEIKLFLLSKLEKEVITFSILDYLQNKECRTPIVYLLPKIHKGATPPPGGPIVSAVNSHTEKI